MIRHCFTAFIFCFLINETFAETNYLIPDLQLNWSTPLANDKGAIGLLGEVGTRNFRLGGSYGRYLNRYQRIKASVEGLAQDLLFSELHAVGRHWLFQGAIGVNYDVLLNFRALQELSLGAAYSHAFGRNFGYDSLGAAQRVCNSDGAFFYLGTTLALGKATLISPAFEYNSVDYRRHYNHDKHVSGAGASLEVIRQLTEQCALAVNASIAPPYNFYGALLNWNYDRFSYHFTSGIYANFTDGKSGLPNNLTAGVQLNFLFGAPVRSSCDPCPRERYSALIQWVASPAVYIPTVLAIADPAAPFVIAAGPVVCVPVAAPSTASLPNGIVGNPYSFNLNTFITAGTPPFTFAVVSGSLPTGLMLTSSTGIISGNPTMPGTFTPTIRISNICSGVTYDTLITLMLFIEPI